jgi:cytochrome c553
MQDRDVIIKKIQSLADTDLQAIAEFLRSMKMKKAAESTSLMPFLRSSAYVRVLLIWPKSTIA